MRAVVAVAEPPRALVLPWLNELTEAAIRSRSLEELLEFIHGRLSALVPFDRLCWAGYDEGGRVIARWVRSNRPRQIQPGYTAEISATALGELHDNRQARAIGNLPDHLLRHPECEATRLLVAEGMRSWLACPLTLVGERRGALVCTSSQAGTYGPGDEAILTELAPHLAWWLERTAALAQEAPFDEGPAEPAVAQLDETLPAEPALVG